MPSAVKPFRNEQANAIGSREPANDTNLKLRNLTVEVPRHQAPAQQFHTIHLGFDAALAVVAAPSSPERTAKVFRRPQGLVARDPTCGDSFPRLGVPAWRNDGDSTPFGDGIVALSGVMAPSAATLAIS